MTISSNPLPFKVILCGESSVGKTTLLSNLSGFQNDSDPTTSCNYRNIKEQYKEKEVNMSFWDTAGQEQYRSLVKIFFLGADVVVYVCDLTSKLTLNYLESWIEEIEQNIGDMKCASLIVANKNDLDSIEISDDDLNDFSKLHNIKWMKVSAISGHNLKYLKKEIAKICIQKNTNNMMSFDQDEQSINQIKRKQKANRVKINDNLIEENKNKLCC